MSALEIIIYSLLGAIVLGLAFKWFIWDIFIKPKDKKQKKNKESKEEQEEKENAE